MNKKKLVETIKKISQELTDAPGVTPPAKTDPPAKVSDQEPFDLRKILNPYGINFPTNKINVPNQSGLPDVPGDRPKPPTSKPVNKSISYGVPAVKEMQKAILNFANAASATDVTALEGNQQGQQYGEQTRLAPGDMPASRDLSAPEDEKKEYLGGSDPFGNFVIQNYIPKDSFTGQQYLNVDVIGNKNRETHSMQPMNLRGIIDSMKRIGTPGSTETEKSADGVWQTRTNNALHIIADLVSAMQNFITDMKIKVPGYTVEQLNEYKSKLPKSYIDLKSPEEIKQRAQELTPHILAMTKFFENLKPSVFNNKNLRQYIDQKTPFAKYEKVSVPDTMKAQGIPGITFPFIEKSNQNWISLNELSSLEAFKKFVDRTIGPTAGDNPETVKKILDMVAQKINLQKDPGY